MTRKFMGLILKIDEFSDETIEQITAQASQIPGVSSVAQWWNTSEKNPVALRLELLSNLKTLIDLLEQERSHDQDQKR